MSVDHLYEETIISLSAADRLRWAVLILNDIPPQSVVDFREDWSQEDLREATLYSLQHAISH